ncbi:hypothetical protein H2199_004816 [Coniosporium tulheliwenetii]|uniref:Uncharacterized protein n=1 Tax=Coniosporium tulheliwenetii TaxID=3383036 RepID=A0ACC2Z4E3_9PEZI|nr:hypothetical protein H2199_004816 [Cladosporium sp. JES 115]
MTDGSQRPLRLLSLDGGGIRGLSSLIILQHIMSGVNASRAADDQLHPWQVFDMIGGTSTGGIIAIMLGRLRMNLDECEDAYLKLSRRIFQPKRRFGMAAKAADFLQANGRFDSKKLEEIIKECIRTKLDEDALLKDADPRCKVFVCAARANNMEPALLRSYHHPKMAEVLFNECKIWEACRATSAATTFFDPITFGRYDQTFVDGAVLYNNPVQLVQREASHIWPGRKAILISIGTGAAPSKSFEGNLLAIVKSMKSILTQTERTANDFYHANQDMAMDRRLFRFNVNRGLEQVGLEEYREIGAVVDATQSYLDHAETSEKLGIGMALSPEFFTKQADVFSLRVEGTGQWLLESAQFKSWLFGAQRTLWCSGIPGAGKTVLASIVIDHLQKTFPDDDTGIAFAYCSHQERTRQTPVNLIGSLLKQLAQERPSLCDLLKPLYKDHRKHNTSPTLSEISTALRTAIAQYNKVFIVIDALDECPEHSGFRDSLLLELGSLSQHVSLLVTSRPHISIEYDIGGAVPLEIQASEDDLRKYLQERIARARRLIRYIRPDQDLKTAIVDTVLGNARGMFLLAQLHMDLIVTKATQNEIRKALENLPKGLDESYRDALKRIESQNQDDCQRAKRTLYWISHALRPLTGDLVHQDILLSICAGLVVIDPESNVFRLVHYSAQKYFEGVRANLFPDAQTDIAGTCLTYVSFEAFASGPCSSDQQLESRVDEHSLLEYAAQNWGNHLRGKPEEVLEARKLALDFLDHRQKVASSIQVTFTNKIDRNKWSQEFPTGVEPLQLAAGFGLTRIARLLVERGADVRSKDSYGTTALHEAASIGNDDLVSLLLTNGADIAAETTNGATALSNAIVGGHESTSLLLLDSGSNLEVIDPYNGTVLHTTAYNGDLKAMQLLLNRGADITAKDDHGNTALHVAAHFGNQAMVEMLLEKGLQSTTRTGSKDARGSTPLHMAAEAGSEAIVKLLLDNGADHNAMAEHGYYASNDDNDSDTIIANFLWDEAQGSFLRQIPTEMPTLRRTNSGMKRGAYVQNWMEGSAFLLPTMSYGGSPLNCAAFRGHVDVVRMLLERGADVGSKDSTRTAALWRAAAGGHDSVVTLLLEHGADVNTKDEGKSGVYDPWIIDQDQTQSYQGTALSRAAYYDHPTTVRLLLKWSANTEQRDSNKATALHIAAAFSSEDVVRALLEYNADIGAKDGYGATPLLRAAFARKPANIRVLLGAGADAKATDDTGLTALHMVAESDRTVHCDYELKAQCDHCDAGKETIRLLLKHGVNLEVRDADGLTPLFFSAQSGYERISGVLLDNGADIKARDDTGSTLLQRVVEEAHIEVVRLLCERKVDLEATDGDGVTALYWATRAQNAEIVRLLVENGANVNGTTGEWETPLQMAISDGQEAIARLLLTGAVDRKNKESALVHAVSAGAEKFVQMLLEAGAGRRAGQDGEEPTHMTPNNGAERTAMNSENVEDAVSVSEEETAAGVAVINNQEGILKLLLAHDVFLESGKLFRDAVLCGHIAIAQLLMKHGVSIEARDEYGCTALHNAAAQGKDDAIRFLVANGADVTAEQIGGENGGPTALFWAANGGHTQTVQILLEAHNPYRTDGGQGEEWALHAAALNGHELAVALLLDHGADIEAKFDKSATVLYWAASAGHEGVTKTLLERGQIIRPPTRMV